MFLRFCPCSFVYLSICLARLLHSIYSCKMRAWIWMKCCVSTDVGTWTNCTFEPDPDYSPDAGTGLLSRISYKRCYVRNFTSEGPTYTYWRPGAAARRGFKMVLFTEPSQDICRR